MENSWSSKIGFVLASAGAAIGLGAIWKFPYVAGMNGGGAFLIIFILFTLLIGLPMLISEFIIGRSTGKEAVSSYDVLAPDSPWRIIGRIGVAGCFFMLSFYSVVGGWVLIYTILSALGLVIRDGADYGKVFEYIIASPWISLAATFLFILVNIVIVASGVQKGIERTSKYIDAAVIYFLYHFGDPRPYDRRCHGGSGIFSETRLFGADC